jgi:hypothetical protein
MILSVEENPSVKLWTILQKIGPEKPSDRIWRRPLRTPRANQISKSKSDVASRDRVLYLTLDAVIFLPSDLELLLLHPIAYNRVGIYCIVI